MSGVGGGLSGSFAEQKLKSFSIGAMGNRPLTKKEQEEARKKAEADEVGRVYKEFVSTFADDGGAASKVNKTWVKAGTFNAGNSKEDTSEKGKLYRPSAKFLDSLPAAEKAAPNEVKSKPEKPGKKKAAEKKKSNLEMFKEELKAMQEEREERHRVKRGGGSTTSSHSRNSDSTAAAAAGGEAKGSGTLSSLLDYGSHDNGDPNTTNLYLGNLSPSLTEQKMMELFGKYGPLASIKIMWPRTEDERSRGKNCGFVAFMCRADGERAVTALGGKVIEGFEMKMGWGKPVPIPLHPIYVPPSLLKFTLPPAPSGMPFNCQTNRKEDIERWKIGTAQLPATEPVPTPAEGTEGRDEFNHVLHSSHVKVVIPTDRTQLCLINRLVEFVVREGPMFEAMIMNREMGNRAFAFLFENRSPEHIYYRWRLFSLLQGDTKEKWSPDEYRMFKGGPVWRPPSVNLYTGGMPDELVDEEEKRGREPTKSERDRDRDDRNRGSDDREKSRSDRDRDRDRRDHNRNKSRNRLSEKQRDTFEDMLKNLYPDRNPLAEAMVWCIEHAEAGEEIVECLAESLGILQTPIAKKVARLYLISDVLHNCSVKGPTNVSYYRLGFQSKFPEIFADLRDYHKSIDSRMKAESFKQRVMSCFKAWEDWALYPQMELIKYQNIFLGLVVDSNNGGDTDGKEDDDADGNSMSDDDDVDGIPLDGAALLKASKGKGKPPATAKRRNDDSDSDVDGAPMRSDSHPATPSSSSNATDKSKLPAGFVPSKWETIEPEEVQAQAITTASKWDLFDDGAAKGKKGITEPDDDDDEEDVDGVPLNHEENQLDLRVSEDRRAKLREIEIQVMKYQDELESGKQAVKSGWTISEQVDHYRKKLIRASANPTVVSAAAAAAVGAPPTPETPASSSNKRTPSRSRRRSADSDDDSDGDDDDDDNNYRSSSSRKSRKKKSKRSRRSSSSSRSRSPPPSSSSSKKKRRRRSRSSSEEERSSSSRRKKRSRSRERSSKHKKKRR